MDIRPTSDRLRETLFNVLTAGNPSALEGSSWLDLFAGTGAVGIEAISRGAAMVYFVESSPAAVGVIRKNLESLGIESGFSILQQDVVRALASLPQANFAFLDPPYQLQDAYRETLTALAATSARSVIAEHLKRFDPGEQFGGLQRHRILAQGDAALSFYRR
jgi:16S rRNA (guanine(966)-N(2))-methyltransferase RsmD